MHWPDMPVPRLCRWFTQWCHYSGFTYDPTNPKRKPRVVPQDEPGPRPGPIDNSDLLAQPPVRCPLACWAPLLLWVPPQTGCCAHFVLPGARSWDLCHAARVRTCWTEGWAAVTRGAPLRTRLRRCGKWRPAAAAPRCCRRSPT